METSGAPTGCHKSALRSTGEVKWNLTEVEAPTVKYLVWEDAIEIQDVRELGMGWAWFVNGLRAFLPAWQDMELARPSPDEPVSQICSSPHPRRDTRMGRYPCNDLLC